MGAVSQATGTSARLAPNCAGPCGAAPRQKFWPRLPTMACAVAGASCGKYPECQKNPARAINAVLCSECYKFTALNSHHLRWLLMNHPLKLSSGLMFENPNGVLSLSPGLARFPEGLPWVKAFKSHLTFERSEASLRAYPVRGDKSRASMARGISPQSGERATE
jgi:hypothetical protein